MHLPYLFAETTTGAGMEAITNGVSNLLQMASTMLDTILGNPVFATLFAVGFVGIGIGIVKRFKHS